MDKNVHLNPNIYFFLKALFIFLIMMTRVLDSQASGLFLSAQMMPLWDTWENSAAPHSRTSCHLVTLVLICLGLPWIHCFCPGFMQRMEMLTLSTLLDLLWESEDSQCGANTSLRCFIMLPSLPISSQPFLRVLSTSFSRCPRIKAFFLPLLILHPSLGLELLSLVWRQGGLVLSLILQTSHSLSPFSVVQLHHVGHD